MTTKTPPMEPLDEQERELARVVRALAGGEPPPALDARILKAAANAAATTQEPRMRWPASPKTLWGLGSTAAAVLAVGIGWQVLRPMPHSLSIQAPAVPQVQSIEQSPAKQPGTPPPSTPVQLQDTAARQVQGPPPAAPPVPRTNAPEARQRPLEKTSTGASPPAPAPATPAVLAAPEPFAQDKRAEQEATAARSSANQPVVTAAAAENAAMTAKAAQAQASTERSAAAVAADESTDRAEDFRETASAWLAHIRQLRRQDRSDEARASLAEFRQRYPREAIPDDLAPLLRE